MNKKAVSKYGSGFMEQLNNGTLSHFASGGEVDEQIVDKAIETDFDIRSIFY